MEENKQNIADCVFDYASDFSEGLAWVKREGKSFCINKQGVNVFPTLRYEYALPFSDGYASIYDQGEQFYIDINGIAKYGKKPFGYAMSFSEGVAFVRYKDETTWYCVDKEFNELFAIDEYAPHSSYTEGYAIVRRESVVPYDQPEDYEYNFIDKQDVDDMGIGGDDKCYEYNFIDKQGHLISDVWYLDAEPFSEGFALVGIEYCEWDDEITFNYIDTQGHILYKEANFYNASSFSEGLGAVALESGRNDVSFSHCYVDKCGNLVMPYKLNIVPNSQASILGELYHSASSFHEGIACIGWEFADGMDGHFINHDGKILYEFSWDSEYFIYPYKEGFAGFADVIDVELQKQYFVDINGENIFGKYFDKIHPFSEGMAIVNDNGKNYFIDKKGNSLHITDCHTS